MTKAGGPTPRVPSEWRALWRRRGRALLTLGGVGCGVFTLILMAALSESFHAMAEHFGTSLGGRLYVCEKLSFWAGGGIIDEDKAAIAARLPGIDTVIPVVIGRLQPREMVVMGLPMVLAGVPAGQVARLWPGAAVVDGRTLDPSDEGKPHALLGSDVAHAWAVRAGQRVRALDCDFTVVGVLARTGGLEDRQMIVPLSRGQEVLGREGLITCMVVAPTDGASVHAVAAALRAALPRLEIIEPAQLAHEMDAGVRLWRALVLACGLVAAAAGTLCIVITMTVSVTERTHEIGLRKAIGASNLQVMGDVLTEAALLAALGWGLGAVAAGGFVLMWNSAFRSEGLILFALSPRVVGASALVSLTFGVLAGGVPAIWAARLDPVVALRRRG